MDKSVKRDITRRYKRMLGEVRDGKGVTDTFFCLECQNVIRTERVDDGVVPMGIECPYCHKEALHQEDDNTKVDVTYEWYRPSLDEVLQMAEEKKLFSVTMILNGGLVRRKR